MTQKLKPALRDNLEGVQHGAGEEVGSRGEAHIYAYGGFMCVRIAEANTIL